MPNLTFSLRNPKLRGHPVPPRPLEKGNVRCHGIASRQSRGFLRGMSAPEHDRRAARAGFFAFQICTKRTRRAARVTGRHWRTRPRDRRRLRPGSVLLPWRRTRHRQIDSAFPGLCCHGPKDGRRLYPGEAVDQIRRRALRLGLAAAPVRTRRRDSSRILFATASSHGKRPSLVGLFYSDDWTELSNRRLAPSRRCARRACADPFREDNRARR